MRVLAIVRGGAETTIAGAGTIAAAASVKIAPWAALTLALALVGAGCSARRATRVVPATTAGGGDADSLIRGSDVAPAPMRGPSGDRLRDDGTLDEIGRAGLDGDAEILRDEGTRERLGVGEAADGSARDVAAEVVHEGWAAHLTRGVSHEFEIVVGSRSDARYRVEVSHGLSGGARRTGAGSTGYVRFEGEGFLRCVHVGGMAMRFGNRLVLGRSFGRYASSDVGTVRKAISLSPSFSTWYGVSGAAAEIGARGVRVGAALTAPPEGFERWRPDALWGWGVVEVRRGILGLVVGRPAGSSVRLSVEDPMENPARSSVASLHAAYRGAAIEASAEAAAIAGDLFYAARFAERGRGRPFQYSLLLFRAPHDPPVTWDGIAWSAAVDQGTRIEGSARARGLSMAASLAAVRASSASRRTSYRRAILIVEKVGRSSLWWELATYFTRLWEESYPTNLVERELAGSTEREWRSRAAVGLRDGGRLLSSVRLDYVPGTDGIGPAVLLLLSTDLVAGRMETRLQLAAYDLSSGRRISIWKPGIGSFERFAAIYGRGSDFSMRVRLNLRSEARLIAAYGTAWPDRRAVYVGIEYGR